MFVVQVKVYKLHSIDVCMNPDLSIVIPVKNEAGNVRELHHQLIQVFQVRGFRYEILFIDDGSTDATLQELLKIKQGDSLVRIFEMRKNVGKALALQVGFSHAKGTYVITIDGDLQDDPVEIPRFVAKLNEGFDVVSGWKLRRKDPLSKTLPSKIFNRLTSLLTRVYIHDFNCGFKAYRREVTQSLLLYGELHRYIPALAAWKGFRVAEISVKHHSRKSGKSKYGFSRLFKGFFDLITISFLLQYKDRPLHLFGTIGFVLFLLGFLAGGYLTYLWYLNVVIWNRPLLILSVLLLILGVQFFFFGLIAEMIATQHVPDARNMVKHEY